MTESLHELDETGAWSAAESEPSAEAALQAAFDADGGPALARHFRITDLQHWIDLCA